MSTNSRVDTSVSVVLKLSTLNEYTNILAELMWKIFDTIDTFNVDWELDLGQNVEEVVREMRGGGQSRPRGVPEGLPGE